MIHPETRAADDPELSTYRSYSGLAVAALVIGLASPLALVGPVLWIVPGVGLLLGWIALRRLSRDASELAGRGAALGGIFFSILWASAAVSQTLSWTTWQTNEARRTADHWFEFLTNDRPAEAHLLTLAADTRPSDATSAEAFYALSADGRAGLEYFVKQRAVRFLLAHGKTCRARFWSSPGASIAAASDVVPLIYAITRDVGGEPTTFFVRVVLRRPLDRRGDENAWALGDVEGGINPFEEPR